MRRLDEVDLQHADHAAPLARRRLVHLVRVRLRLRVRLRVRRRLRIRLRIRVRLRLRVRLRVRETCTPPTWA